jgi:hypothetical protein
MLGGWSAPEPGLGRRRAATLTIGKYVLDFEVVCKGLDPEALTHRVEYLPIRLTLAFLHASATIGAPSAPTYSTRLPAV